MQDLLHVCSRKDSVFDIMSHKRGLCVAPFALLVHPKCPNGKFKCRTDVTFWPRSLRNECMSLHRKQRFNTVGVAFCVNSHPQMMHGSVCFSISGDGSVSYIKTTFPSPSVRAKVNRALRAANRDLCCGHTEGPLRDVPPEHNEAFCALSSKHVTLPGPEWSTPAPEPPGSSLWHTPSHAHARPQIGWWSL